MKRPASALLVCLFATSLACDKDEGSTTDPGSGEGGQGGATEPAPAQPKRDGLAELMKDMDPKADPLGPDNVLIFATGPLTGTMAPTSARYAVITKGPLTNAIACSNSGGKFGAELKFAGYDLLLIEGSSKKPVYLNIVDDTVEILSADEIWGTTVWNTEHWIKEHHKDPLIKVAS